jgi:transposase
MSHTNTRQSDHPAAPPAIPDPEVVVKPKRRQFTADYKRRILQEAEACTQPGEIGALLRREGLYSSHLTTWRQHRQRGELQGLAPAKRGRKADPQAAEIAQLQREKARLQAQVERAELIIEVQKKLSHLLGLPEIGSDDNT